jgi:hypothetical protein
MRRALVRMKRNDARKKPSRTNPARCPRSSRKCCEMVKLIPS